MYHSGFKGSCYEAGFKWGSLLKKNGMNLSNIHHHQKSEERKRFAKDCVVCYQTYFPEALDEIQGIADGQQIDVSGLYTFLFSMYCFEMENHCTCFVMREGEHTYFCRNSDFLTALEKTNDSPYYQLEGSNSFIGQTTAFVEIEDGINSYGLAAGLTFVYPHIKKPGLNSGMLVKYLLMKCKTVEEAVQSLKKLPIATAQTITLADREGNMAVVECNPVALEVIYPQDREFVATANNFHSDALAEYRNPDIDDWRSTERYLTARDTLQKAQYYDVTLGKEILSGKHGFMCQYDRNTGADTVWSVIYEINQNRIWRADGNPSRYKFKTDLRLKFL